MSWERFPKRNGAIGGQAKRRLPGRVIIEPVAPSYTLADLLVGITPENRHANLDFGLPQGRESL